MPLYTIQELEQAAPIFRGRAGRALGHAVLSLLAMDKVNALYDRNAHHSGPDFARSILEGLNIRYEISTETSEVMSQLNVLCKEPFISISNHPYGSIDGIILADLFGHLCPDYKIMVNNILGRIEAMATSFIPVTPTKEAHSMVTTESILGIRRALTQLYSGGSLGLFPAGAVSDLSLRDFRVRDREWQHAIIRLIAKAKVPIVPVRFYDGNSPLYYSLGLIDWRIRLLRLPAEVFNKSRHPAHLRIGTPIGVREQEEYLATHTTQEFGLWLRSKVYDRP